MSDTTQSNEVTHLIDLRQRLAVAAGRLDALVDTYWESTERVRVRGKAEGVRMALSYVEEALRGDESSRELRT